MKCALVCGGHGFIGSHMARQLKKEDFWVRTVDIQEYPYGALSSEVDDYVIGDLRDVNICKRVTQPPKEISDKFDEVYQFAAWMGGAGVIFTGNNDAVIMHDSGLININMAEACKENKPKKIFFSSSACVYNQINQENIETPITSEDSAYPAWPDSSYGWEKIFSENLWNAFHRNYGLDIRIARFHNIFGPLGAWNNGKEKAPAAVTRKVAMAEDGGEIEIWGPGIQTRSFLFIEECLEAVRRFMDSDFIGPMNIGSEEMISINDLAKMATDISGKNLTIKNIEGPLGVMGRNSDNNLMRKKLGWSPSKPLRYGIEKLYAWINEQVKKQ